MKQTASRSNNKGKFQSRDRLVVHLPLPHSTLPIYVMFPSSFFLLSIPSLLLTRGVYMVALFGRALFSRLWISISFHFPSSLASSFIFSQWHDSFFFLLNRTWSHTHSKERKTAAELSFACESSGCVYNIHTYTRIHTICVCVCCSMWCAPATGRNRRLPDYTSHNNHRNRIRWFEFKNARRYIKVES